jgi:uncharacterized membrane protein YgcG
MKPSIHPAKKFKTMIVKRFSVRFHMFLILTAVITFGLVLSRILLLAGITNLTLRSSIVILVSYGFFFLSIRIWLFYVLPSFRKKESSSSSFDGADPEALELPEDPEISIPDRAPAVPGGGGTFSGAGAGGSWNSTAAVNSASTQAAAAHSAGSDSSSFSLDDIDGAGAIVVLLIFLVIAALLGGSIYLIIEAPVILSEAAFNALLSGGMIRATGRMRGEDWTGSILKATWIPFMIIAVITIGSAAVLTKVFPGETNISDIMRHTLLQ